MFQMPDVSQMASALAAHQGARLGLVAENVANADTPGYRARDLPDFATVWAQGGAMRATRPGHFGAETPEPPRPVVLPGPAGRDGNTVSLDDELIRAATIRQGHDMALAIYRGTTAILRAGLRSGGA